MLMQLFSEFPNLKYCSHQKTSEETTIYNCIGFAAGETDRWWWPTRPDGYWPPKAPRVETLESFIIAFETLGYKTCDNSELEQGFEKVAIYIGIDGNPKHMARQLDSGKWTSKLGNDIDIEHATLEGMESDLYGKVAQIMKRPI